MRARATDPYKLLSVPWDADELTVRKRYRQLAKQHHPNAGGDSEDFRLLKEAFEQILFDVRNNIEEDVTIARVRPEENRKQELNEEPTFGKIRGLRRFTSDQAKRSNLLRKYLVPRVT